MTCWFYARNLGPQLAIPITICVLKCLVLISEIVDLNYIGSTFFQVVMSCTVWHCTHCCSFTSRLLSHSWMSSDRVNESCCGHSRWTQITPLHYVCTYCNKMSSSPHARWEFCMGWGVSFHSILPSQELYTRLKWLPQGTGLPVETG